MPDRWVSILPDGTLMVHDARIVDVRTSVAGEPMDVRVSDGRFVAIERATTPPAGVDRWLLPGLIDAHVHLSWDGGLDPVGAWRSAPLGHPADERAERARRALAAGVTTLRDLGGPAGSVAMTDALPGPDGLQPDILAAGPPLTRPGGHLSLFGGDVSTPAAAAERVAAALDAGARAVKLVLSGGGLTPGTRPSAADLPLEIARAAVVVARRAGVPVAAHCHATDAIRVALAAGVTTVEHASCVDPDGVARFDDALARDLALAGIAVVPTAVGALRTAARYRLAGGASPTDPGAIARLEARAAFTPRWAAAGVTLVAGTDAGVTETPFDTLPDELAAWVSTGISPADALRGATFDAARVLGLTDRGEVQPGLRADLVLLDADPLRDISALRRPAAVVAAGRLTTPGAPGPDRPP